MCLALSTQWTSHSILALHTLPSGQAKCLAILVLHLSSFGAYTQTALMLQPQCLHQTGNQSQFPLAASTVIIFMYLSSGTYSILYHDHSCMLTVFQVNSWGQDHMYPSLYSPKYL